MAAFGGPIAWGAPPPERFPQEIVVTARASDAVLAARVETSLAKDPYILSDHRHYLGDERRGAGAGTG